MKIGKLHINHLRNGEHFQFHTEFKKTVNKTGADKLKIAERLRALFDTYGNLANKKLNEQTGLTYNIVKDLEVKYAEDMKTVGIEKWVAELKKTRLLMLENGSIVLKQAILN